MQNNKINLENKTICIKGYKIGSGKPMICVPVMASRKEDIIDQIRNYTNSDRKIEMIEWRVDAFSQSEDMEAINEVLQSVKEYLENTVFIYTYRSCKQGGMGKADDKTIKNIHMTGAKSNVVDFIDIEYFANERPKEEIKDIKAEGVRVITSHHDFDETPDEGIISMLLEKMNESGADIVKLALMPESMDDVFALLKQTANFKEKYPDKPIITMSMGKNGSISRIAGQYFGSCVTFGAVEESSAPGQLPYDDLDVILKLIDKNIN